MAAAVPTHVVLLPDPGSGHLMSLIQAGTRILGSSNATTLTVLLVRPPTPDTAAKAAAQVQRVAASEAGAAIRFQNLPAIEAPEPFPPGQVPAFKSRYMQLYAPHVKAALAELRPAPAALLLDFFATAVLDDLGVPAYVYFTSTAAFLALMLRLPALQEDLPLDFADMDDGTVHIPGMSPIPAACMPIILARKNTLNYSWFVSHGRRFMEADGIVVNTVAELEPGILGAIEAGRCVPGRAAPPLYPIGPVIDLDVSSASAHRCVAWLDTQPPGSVVYLCFGSVGWFDAAQAREIAAGLERSGHRFLWVLRGPPAAGSGSHHPTDGDAEALLPEGFLEQTAARGLVWPAWAPQREILAHAAVGAFVTHGGWNSCLESLWSGVPMVPWPLYAEQHLNAFQAVAEMGVAVALEGAGGNKRQQLVEAAAVERAVRSVMGETEEGARAREKAMRVKLLCRKAVATGGSSHAALHRLCHHITRD